MAGSGDQQKINPIQWPRYWEHEIQLNVMMILLSFKCRSFSPYIWRVRPPSIHHHPEDDHKSNRCAILFISRLLRCNDSFLNRSQWIWVLFWIFSSAVGILSRNLLTQSSLSRHKLTHCLSSAEMGWEWDTHLMQLQKYHLNAVHLLLKKRIASLSPRYSVKQIPQSANIRWWHFNESRTWFHLLHSSLTALHARTKCRWGWHGKECKGSMH